MATQRRFVIGLAAAAVIAASGTESAHATAGEPDASDSTMAIPAGVDGVDLGAFTVEGEDRIRIEFERPVLDLALDPRSVGGLDRSRPDDIVERKPLDTTTAYLRTGTRSLDPLTTRPWARTLVYEDIVRLKPKLEDVARWRLTISDAAGREVSRYGGTGNPPDELVWDGMTISGHPAWPGETYVHAFDIEDHAGNRRRFNGKGFVMPPFASTRNDSLQLVVAGRPGRRSALAPLTMLELADWINQHATLDTEVRLETLARSYPEAESMAGSARDALAETMAGNPARLRMIARVDPAAPAGGILTVRFRVGHTPPVPRRR